MQLLLTVLHLGLAVALVGLILIQHGRGADAGAAFGSGASATVFGAQGSGSFLTRSTAILAAMFFLTSIALAYFAAQVGEPKGLMDEVERPAALATDTSDVPKREASAGDAAADRAAALGQGQSLNDLPNVEPPVPLPGTSDMPVSEPPADAGGATPEPAPGPSRPAADGDLPPMN